MFDFTQPKLKLGVAFTRRDTWMNKETESNKNDIGVFSDKPFSYNSENNSHFLTVDEISDLIKNHVI